MSKRLVRIEIIPCDENSFEVSITLPADKGDGLLHDYASEIAACLDQLHRALGGQGLKAVMGPIEDVES